MTDLEKAARLALEALEDVPYMSNKDDYERLERVKTALRQALVNADDTSEKRVDETAKQEHEPVAFINVEKQKLEWAKLTSWHTPTIVNLPKIPLYTAPTKREWVGLTQQDIDIAFDDTQEGGGFYEFALAIEAILKGKNT